MSHDYYYSVLNNVHIFACGCVTTVIVGIVCREPLLWNSLMCYPGFQVHEDKISSI